jgi:hypothetical protein
VQKSRVLLPVFAGLLIKREQQVERFVCHELSCRA